MEGVPGERHLADRVAAGDEDAVRLLFDRYAPALYQLLYRLLKDGDDAHDAVQETFLRAVREIESYRGGSLGGWLRSTAFRVGLNTIRAGRRRREREGRWAASAAETVAPTDPTLLRAVERLPERYRRVVLLFYFEDQPHEHISETLGIPVGTSKTWLARARERLRHLIEPEGQP